MREFSFLMVVRNISTPGILYMMKTLVQTNSTNGGFFAPDHPVILKEALSFFFFLVSVNHNPYSQKKKKSLPFSHHCFSKCILQNTVNVNRFSLLQTTRWRANFKLIAPENSALAIQSAFPTLCFTLGTLVPLLTLTILVSCEGEIRPVKQMHPSHVLFYKIKLFQALLLWGKGRWVLIVYYAYKVTFFLLHSPGKLHCIVLRGKRK